MHTAIIATLERKGIINREEGEKLVEFIANRPQPTQLNDAFEQVSEFIEPAGKSAKADSKPAGSKTAAEADEIDKAVGGKADNSQKSGEK